MATTIVAGVIVFLCGQILQQFILAPVQEFRQQRADTIYFTLRFKDLLDSNLKWDDGEKTGINQMKAALIYSLELIPWYDFLSGTRVFGLPKRENVHLAAHKIGKLADIVNSKSGAVLHRDLPIAEEIGALLGAKFKLTNSS